MKKVCLLFMSLCILHTAFAQSSKKTTLPIHIGLGFGMDYGGMGFKVEYLPVKYLGIFGGLGYNFYSLGINGGLAFRPLPDVKLQPLVIAMYGYNGAIKISGSTTTLALNGLDDVSKTYYGFTTGVGGELKVGRKDNRLYLAVLYPFRSQTFRDNYDKVKNSPVIDTKGELLPITISIGFNWVL